MANRIALMPLFVWLLLCPHIRAQENPFPAEKEMVSARLGSLLLKKGDYQGHPADYGLLAVPEIRSQPDTRLLLLPLIRVRATEPQAREPVFFLQGGPGATALSPSMPDFLYRENDLVMVGYRGVDGNSSIDCPEVIAAVSASMPLSSESLKRLGEAMAAGFERLKKKGVDLNAYNMLEVVEDIELARKALEYPKINLWSHSYGTQVAYVYCVAHPESIVRNLVTGASVPGRLGAWDPAMVDRQLRYYADLCRKDPDCSSQTSDLTQTISRVMKTLPRDWQGTRVDPDRIRVVAFQSLFNSYSAIPVFEAFLSADKGDYAGLAFLSASFDNLLKSRLNSGDFACKILTSGDIDLNKNWEEDMDPPGSILGSPMAKMNWGPLHYVRLQIQTMPQKYRTSKTAVQTLIVNGSVDFSSPPEYAVKELLPLYTQGRVVLLKEMGHSEVLSKQLDAYRHLWETFFRTGKVDDSKFTYAPVNFRPQRTLGEMFREMKK